MSDETFGLRPVLRRAVSVGTGRVVGQLVNLLFFPVILRFVSPAEFGAFTLLQTASLVWGVVMSVGLSTVFVARTATSSNAGIDPSPLLGSHLTQQLVIGGILLAGGVVLAPTACHLLAPDAPVLALVALLVAEFVANHALIVARWQILTERQGQVSVTAVARAVVFVGAGVIATGPYHLGVLGLALADLASDLAAAAVSAVCVRGHVRVGFSRDDLKATFALGLPATPDTIFFWLTVSMPLYVLRRAGQADAAGVFGVAWRLGALVDLLGNAVALGSAGQILRAGPSRHREEVFRNGIALIAGTSLALGAFAPEGLRWFFPAQVSSAAPLTPLVCLASFFLAAYYFEWVGLSGTRRTVGLTVASGAGTVTGAMGFLALSFTDAAPPRATAAAGVFALSFAAMWLAARWMRGEERFGRSAVVILGGLFASALALALQRLPLSPGGFGIKVLVISAVALSVVRWEVARRRQGR
jgi:O-antigen/teichoic acid export membrane protein